MTFKTTDFQHNGFFLKSEEGFFMSEHGGPVQMNGMLFLSYEQASSLYDELQHVILKNPPYVEVKKSKLSGEGLFTNKKIKKGEKIIEYLGEIIDSKEYDKRVQAGNYGYMFYVDDQTCIDSYETKHLKGRYVNDAAGLLKKATLKNNSSYVVEGKQVFIVADRDIRIGEEIFVSYGKTYWSDIKYNNKLDKITV